ncbi:MAG: hypothetical protein HXY50_08720, partial [Ignavibacteriaceae bacterium]|nr:hypothetical protein [Ignavibacteriaceae bacterium]
MENLEKLLSLIEKKHLNDIDQKLLHNLLENDTSLNDFYKTYQKLGRAFTTSKHLTADELADYILVKDKLEPSNILNLQNIFQLEEHLHHCSKCSNELE